MSDKNEAALRQDVVDNARDLEAIEMLAELYGDTPDRREYLARVVVREIPPLRERIEAILRGVQRQRSAYPAFVERMTEYLGQLESVSGLDIFDFPARICQLVGSYTRYFEQDTQALEGGAGSKLKAAQKQGVEAAHPVAKEMRECVLEHYPEYRPPIEHLSTRARKGIARNIGYHGEVERTKLIPHLLLDMCGVTAREILSVRNCGPIALQEIRESLAEISERTGHTLSLYGDEL